MIKIIRAFSKDILSKDWQEIINTYYGKNEKWFEKKFRFKAVENGKLIGTIDGKCEPGVIYLSSLITTKNARRNGVGKMLIKKAEVYGKKLGAHRIWLYTGNDWPANLFYKHLGFKSIGSFSDFHFHKNFTVYTRLIK